MLWKYIKMRFQLNYLFQSEVKLNKILLENMLLLLFGMSNLTVSKLLSCKIVLSVLSMCSGSKSQ